MKTRRFNLVSYLAITILLHSPLAQSDGNLRNSPANEADKAWLTKLMFQANHDIRLHEETAEKLEPGYMQNRIINWTARSAAVIGAIAAGAAVGAAFPAIAPFAENLAFIQGYGWVEVTSPAYSALFGGMYTTVPVALGSAMVGGRHGWAELSEGGPKLVQVTIAPPVVLKSEEIKTAMGFEDLLESLHSYVAKSKDQFALKKSDLAAAPPEQAYKSDHLQKELKALREAEKEIRSIAQRLSKKYDSYSLFGGNQKNYWRILMYESQALAELSKLKALWAEERLLLL
jgi:hypothetical protein